MADLQQAFKKAAQTAFNAVGTVKNTVTYRSKTNKNPTYTPGTNAVSDAYTDYEIDIVREDYRSREIDNRLVLVTDIKAIIPVDNMTVTPKINDVIVIDEVTWEVVDIHKDPADALYTFQLRRP